MGSRVEGLVFDFDGVLADTEPLHWKSWAELLSRHGITLTWNEYCRVGRGYRDSVMLDNLGISDGRLRNVLDQSAEERRAIMRKWYAQESPIRASCVEALRALQGYRLGLVTSSERTEVEPLLQAAGIQNLFGACVYGDNVVQPKPHPEPYILIRRRLGIRTGMAFEDSNAGIASAEAAGWIAVRVNSPDELPSLLRTLKAAKGPA